jgi:hypothetical protein
MKNRPISPEMHAIMDYSVSALQMTLPAMLGLNKKAVATYATLGSGVLGLTAFSDTPVGLQRTVSMKTHKNVDTGLLASQVILGFANFIRNDRKALIFHIALSALVATQYFLTDYKGGR